MDGENFKLSSAWHDDVLEFTLTGQISENNPLNIARQVAVQVNEDKPGKMLFDCRQFQGRLSTSQTFFHVREDYGAKHFPYKIAIVDNPQNSDYHSFHETAAVNVGLKLRYFTAIEAARDWLRQ